MPTSVTRKPFDESWIRRQIALHPEQLGLGSLTCLAREIDYRLQQENGKGYNKRLDLLFSDGRDTQYTVEVQLGRLDCDHLVRTITYCDLARHGEQVHGRSTERVVPVIVAQQFTDFDSYMIGLFGKLFDLLAIQLSYSEVDGHVSLMFRQVEPERSYSGNPFAALRRQDRDRFEGALVATLAEWSLAAGTRSLIGAQGPVLDLESVSRLQRYQVGIFHRHPLVGMRAYASNLRGSEAMHRTEIEYATHKEVASLQGRPPGIGITRDRAWWINQSSNWKTKVEIIEACARLWQRVEPSLHLEFDVRGDYLPVQPERWAENIFGGWPHEDLRNSGRALVIATRVPDRERWINELVAVHIDVDRRREAEDATKLPNKLRFWLRLDDVERHAVLLQSLFRESFTTYWSHYAL